jgi:hypothetical protein
MACCAGGKKFTLKKVVNVGLKQILLNKAES